MTSYISDINYPPIGTQNKGQHVIKISKLAAKKRLIEMFSTIKWNVLYHR